MSRVAILLTVVALCHTGSSVSDFDDLPIEVPFRFGMSLGRTYDMPTQRIGVDIFAKETNKAVENFTRPHSTFRFALVNTTADGDAFLGVRPELALLFRHSATPVHILHSYFAAHYDRTNEMKIIIDMQHSRNTVGLPPGIIPGTGLCRGVMDSHYVNKIVYGKRVISFLVCRPKEKHLLDNIKKSFKTMLGSEGLYPWKRSEFIAFYTKYKGIMKCELRTSVDQTRKTKVSDVKDLLDLIDDAQAKMLRESDVTAISVRIKPTANHKTCTYAKKWRTNWAAAKHLYEADNAFADINAGLDYAIRWLTNNDRLPQHNMKEISTMCRKMRPFKRNFDNLIMDMNIINRKWLENLKRILRDYKILTGSETDIVISTLKQMADRAIAALWTPWETWGSCTKTCGEGVRKRGRTCRVPDRDADQLCKGSTHEFQKCSLNACPVHGGWCAWITTSTISIDCGYGAQNETRECRCPEPANGGLHCNGASKNIISHNCRGNCWYDGTAPFCEGKCGIEGKICGESNCGGRDCCFTGRKKYCCSHSQICVPG